MSSPAAISTFSVRSIEIRRATEKSFAAGVTIAARDQPPSVSLNSANGVWRADIRLHGSTDCQRMAAAATGGAIRCVVGDYAEVTDPAQAAPYVNATVLELDYRGSLVRASTSLTGLPPVFVFRRGGDVSLSCPFLPSAARGPLQPDPEGIADFLRWGHPIDGRTLFLNLNAIASNSSVTISDAGELTTQQLRWPNPTFSSLTRTDIVSEQVAAFGRSAARFASQNVFLSLSGGLDSRAALVALIGHAKPVLCITMAGSDMNLDARLAAAYCRTHGLAHQIVLLDQSFQTRMPQLLAATSDLSGGVACLSQTIDLHLYDSLSQPFDARVSGNLGNQVGRGGVESLSVYQPKGEIFSRVIRERLAARPLTPWFIPRLTSEGYGEALFGQEVHFWSIPNYVVGSSRAQQLTPYADRELLLLARAGFTRDPELQPPSWEMLRKRDVRHRMAGTPRDFSFQRQFIAQNDRRGLAIPLNWGWRAAGGTSLRWRLSALATATDAAMTKIRGQSSRLRPVAEWASARLGHRASFVDWVGIVKQRLRDLTFDTTMSQAVRESGAFDTRALDTLLTRHFDGTEDSHQTVVRALELSLGIYSRAKPGP